MTKVKKLFCLMIVILLIGTAMMVGCGKTNIGSTEENSQQPKEEKVTTKNSDNTNLKPVKLKWYFVGNGQQKDVDLVEQEANKYMKDKINASIELQCFDWGSYSDRMRTIIASGEKFDICFTSSWTNYYRQQATKGAFIALNDEKELFKKYAPKTKEMLGEDFLKGSQIDGINYAIPANKEKAHNTGFVFKKDLVAKYNFDISKVKKLKDLEPMLKVIKENEPNVYGLQAAGGEDPFRHLPFDQIGDNNTPGVIYTDSKDFKVINQYDTPEAMQYFKTMHKYYKAGYIREDVVSVTDFNADEAAGKIFVTNKSLKPGKDAEMSLAHGFDWVQVDITQPIIATDDTTGSMQAISRTSDNPERALMFLELFNSDKYLNNLINFGIEGKHYEKKSETAIDFPSGIDASSSGYNPGTTWMFGNVFINYLWPKEDPQKWEKFKNYNENAKPSVVLGFTFDPTPVKNEIAACANVNEQYFKSLLTGALDPEVYLLKALESYKTAGADKIIAEKQKQLNEWSKKNK